MGRRTRAAAETRRSPEGRRRALLRSLRAAGDGAKLGALAGGGIAGAALLVGAGRLALAWLGGARVAPTTTWHEVGVLASYVLALSGGGALVGAIHAAWANRLVTMLAFMGAGAFLTNTIAYLELRSYDSVDMAWMTALGCMFGLAAAYGIAKKA